MINLVVDNSLSQITGLSIEEHKKLREVLSCLPNPSASFYSGGIPHRQYLIDKAGRFPTGLLYLVEEFLKGPAITAPYFCTKDNRVLPASLKTPLILSLGYQPYPEQEEAATAALEHRRGIIVAPTGVGKSAICALIIAKLQVTTLVVVPTLELKRQLTASLKAAFGADRVGPGRTIRVENVDSLDSNRPLKDVDCVIIDEFHHSGAKSYRKLNQKAWNGVFYRFGLTATPFRSQDNERLLLESVLSSVVYNISYETAVSAKYIVPLEAYYIDLPAVEVQGYSWQEVYKELVVNNKPRNQIIANFMTALHAAEVPTLCLVKEIAHGAALEELTGAGFANGQSDDTAELIKWFSSGQLRSLIGTTGVVGEGVDTKPAEFVIIAGLGKSKNQFMQQVGRAFRTWPGKDSAKVLLLRDKSHKWTLAHFKAQCKYLLDEYNVKPIKLTI